MLRNTPYSVMSAREAVAGVKDGDTIAFSGFSPAGSAKIVPTALAERAQVLKQQGEPFKLRVLTGASSGRSIDDLLARAGAIGWRAPYQAEACLRHQINAEEVEYVDMHLSHVPMCPHVDNNEHSVEVIVTEQGLADLRGLGPSQRARAMINQCAHPMYREYLERYVRDSRGGHIRHDLNRCFELHRNLLASGSMLP